MINIQLFLEDQELELNKDVEFPLNKSFENLFNPTDIIVEYSKSINVPCTAKNNKIMANAYRLDRQFVGDTDNKNIGMYLDPLKRIPMKLIYNGAILLDGYAKYTSATVNTTDSYYTFNLYGALGNVFQTLMECVFDKAKLTEEQLSEPDGGAKYVIETPWAPAVINKDLVYESWRTTDTTFDSEHAPNNIGFAPAYRGYYDDFESNSIAGLRWRTILDDPNPTKPKSVDEVLKNAWTQNYINRYIAENGEPDTEEEKNKLNQVKEEAKVRADGVDIKAILPNGLNEHNMRQFRSYEQKPFIYFHALMKLYQNKCKELTGYEIKLDQSWFNANNPYWTKLCYMLDYLSVRGNTLQSSQPLTGYNESKYASYSPTSGYAGTAVSYNITDSKVLNFGNITVRPFTICTQSKVTPFSEHTNPSLGEVILNATSAILVNITAETAGNTYTFTYWGGSDYKSANRGGMVSKYTTDNFIVTTNESVYDSSEGKVIGRTYITIPSFTIPHTAGDDLKITYNIDIKVHRPSGPTSGYEFAYRYNDKHATYKRPVANSNDWLIITPNTEFATNWRNTTECTMKNLWTKDESMFNVILQYTKMFSLIWKCDYSNKTITIMNRKEYFKDYHIEDWTDRVDRSKSLIIESVAFNSKYVLFNYKDAEGYRYTGYKNKYGVNYGEKRLKTKYNFDTNTNSLFKEPLIQPSSISCKSYEFVDDLYDWDTLQRLLKIESEIDFIDSENDEQKSAVNLNNWYFRIDNVKTDNTYFIADATRDELADEKYYWVSDSLNDIYEHVVSIDELPQFTPVFKNNGGFVNTIGNPIGCLYNCPNDDYSKSKAITDAKDNYVYDICWRNYINERYNSNNKKLTCYIKLTPYEFQEFNFNKFIVIDNQLFMLNKIIDFNITDKITKVEMVQVTDPKEYMTQKLEFPVIAYDKTAIYITSENGRGSSDITFSSFPSIDDYTIVPIFTETQESICFVEGADSDGFSKTLPIVFESTGDWDEKYELRVRYSGEEITIPIYINNYIDEIN